MGKWTQLLQGKNESLRIYEGVIAQDASSATDQLLVTVIAFDKELTWGPGPFMPRVDDDGNVDLPQEGDRCVMILAETDQPGEPTVWILGYSNA